MSSERTCLACGHVGTDVAMGLAAYEDPVEVTVGIRITNREGAIEVPRKVPGRYGAEWRCRDALACQARVHAMDAPPAPEAHVAAEDPPSAEGGPSWLTS